MLLTGIEIVKILSCQKSMEAERIACTSSNKVFKESLLLSFPKLKEHLRGLRFHRSSTLGTLCLVLSRHSFFMLPLIAPAFDIQQAAIGFIEQGLIGEIVRLQEAQGIATKATLEQIDAP